MIIGSKIKM